MSDDDDARYPRFSSPSAELTTLFQQRLAAPDEPEATFVLHVVKGPETGARILVGGGGPNRVVAGTSPTCDLKLTDRQVSRRQVAFSIESSLLNTTDLDSKNGTWLGSASVREALLAGGEHLLLGETVLFVERGARASANLPRETRFGSSVGASREMRRLYPLLQRLAAANVPVIIEGETGTGKEVIAESIHAAGPRREGPFVVFDCTAVSASLVESELFGHERGAFTGAVAARRGVFEQAHGGTLLIDEIGDLDASLQPKLLRAIERSEIRRVGGDGWIHVDVRLLAATRRDLDREVQAGRFRDDLLHRLAVARVELPPLRKRRDDIPLLVAHFVSELGGTPDRISAATVAAWCEQPWPGNVRELRNVVARQLALGELAGLALGPARTAEVPSVEGAFDAIIAERLPFVEARERVLAAFERRYLDAMLEATGGNVARAAAHAGIARRYFQILNARRKT